MRRLFLLLRRPWATRAIEAATLLVALVIIAGTYFAVLRQGAPQRPLTPPAVAGLLVANLVPAMALLVLVARRVALHRARRWPLGGRGRLHMRLVALFSAVAAVPTLLVVIFASLLFQYGVEFWFSDKARVVLENSDRVAQTYVEETRRGLGADNAAMAGDIVNALRTAPMDDPRWSIYFAQQVLFRSLNQAAMIAVGKDGQERLIAGANLDKRPLEERLPRDILASLADGKPQVSTGESNKLESVVQLAPGSNLYLYVQRATDPVAWAQASHSASALAAYKALLDRSRVLQLRFNAALFVISLLIVGVAIWVALNVADRLARPLGELAGAARRVAAGDLSARVPLDRTRRDEVGTLAKAFNRMTRTLEEQTGALVSANRLIDSRRALTEAVLSGVSAGVISVGADRRVRLINLSAEAILRVPRAEALDAALSALAPELDGLIEAGESDAVVQYSGGGEPRVLAVRQVATEGGHVLTFDDITQQLADQRRAAWADVARRIAHEIKNPLTPIQLAAERLQRRYGREVTADDGMFERLTGTIVRQVGDIRRMVDEFSAFARMPKPRFAAESMVDLCRQALFLHEVAHPAIAFRLEAPDAASVMVCDRRQLGQALTNIVKNAVEAIEARGGEGASGRIDLGLTDAGAGEARRLAITISDDGIGLPGSERERITEPYVTTRARGTGLGLAIVRKIIEEHSGMLTFSDRPGGGTIVQLEFPPAVLDALLEEPVEARGVELHAMANG